MFANLRPTIARWDLLLLGLILPGRYRPRHARPGLWGFIDRRRAALLKVANRGHVAGLRPLPSRALRGWHRACFRAEQAAAWVRRGAFMLTVAVALYNAACGGTAIRT